MSTAGSGVRLRAVDSAELPRALTAALAGGPPVAPLPAEPVERRQTLDTLRLDEPVSEPDAAVVVSTSGSTGRPKGVVLSRAAIAASASATHDRLGGPGDWVLALPGHYVAGLMVLARAAVAGTTAHAVRSDLADLPAAVVAPGRRRYISVVATQLVRACRDATLTEALASFDAVLLGGGPCPPGLLEQAAALGVRVVTTYGMSETCGGCVYDGEPLLGVTVALEESGRVRLGGPTVFSGYRLDPERTAEVLEGDQVRTEDRGRWADGRLEVLGRLDDVVISGGRNVDLAEVERLARSAPRAQGHELAVLGRPDPEWGTTVVAVTDADLELDQLHEHLAGRLPAYAFPKALLRLEALPHTSSGKIDRQRLADRLQRGTVVSPESPRA